MEPIELPRRVAKPTPASRLNASAKPFVASSWKVEHPGIHHHRRSSTGSHLSFSSSISDEPSLSSPDTSEEFTIHPSYAQGENRTPKKKKKRRRNVEKRKLRKIERKAAKKALKEQQKREQAEAAETSTSWSSIVHPLQPAAVVAPKRSSERQPPCCPQLDVEAKVPAGSREVTSSAAVHAIATSVAISTLDIDPSTSHLFRPIESPKLSSISFHDPGNPLKTFSGIWDTPLYDKKGVQPSSTSTLSQKLDHLMDQLSLGGTLSTCTSSSTLNELAYQEGGASSTTSDAIDGGFLLGPPHSPKL